MKETSDGWNVYCMFQKRNQRWRNAQRMLGAALPSAMVNDLMNRELDDSDYDALLQLDKSVC